MKRQKILLHLFLVLVGLTSGSCAGAKGAGLARAVPGSGNIQSESRDSGSFQTITVEYPADVVIQQGEQAEVRIEADDNLLPQLSTEVSAGRLIIKNHVSAHNARINPSRMVRILIIAKDLKEIDFAPPAGTLELNDFRGSSLRLLLSGAGQVRVKGIHVDVFEGTLSGVGDIQVSGMADELRLLQSGMGNFDLAGLQANKAVVELSGTGDVTVRVEAELKATISGAGSVKYFGNPRVEQNVTGMGSVKPAG